jgi:hypothetical protein
MVHTQGTSRATDRNNFTDRIPTSTKRKKSSGTATSTTKRLVEKNIKMNYTGTQTFKSGKQSK